MVAYNDVSMGRYAVNRRAAYGRSFASNCLKFTLQIRYVLAISNMKFQGSKLISSPSNPGQKMRKRPLKPFFI